MLLLNLKKWFKRIDNVDNFDYWCYENGIDFLPSKGSKIGDKLGISKHQMDAFYRFDLTYQLKRLSDFLLAFQIPVYAIMAKYVITLHDQVIKFNHKEVNFLSDLEL